MSSYRPTTWFVTGATGLVGSTVIEMLRSNEIHVIALVRKSSPPQMIDFLSDLDVKLVYGDLLAVETYLNYLPVCDVVVHTAAAVLNSSKKINQIVNVEGTRILCQALADTSVKRLIHLSTAGLYGTEIIDNTTEDIIPKPYGPYLQTKYRAEKIILEEFPSLSTTIIRPPFIFGEPDRDRNFFPSLKKLPTRVIPRIWRYNPTFSFVHAEDIARFVFLVGTNFTTPSIIYNIKSFDIRLSEIMEIVNEARETDPISIPFPYSLLYILSLIGEGIMFLLGKRLYIRKRLRIAKTNWSFSSRKARIELGFEPIHGDPHELERLLTKYFRIMDDKDEFENILKYMNEDE